MALLSGCELARQAISQFSDWDIDIMTAIATSESGGCKADARGDGGLTYYQDGREYGYSVSILQVRILPGREHCDTNDINTNVSCAHDIWLGQGYNAWTDYTNGKYKKYLRG